MEMMVYNAVIMIPPTLLVFGAGYAFSQAIGFGWGVLAAILSCSIGSCVGATLAFWRSRYMMRDLIYIFSKRYPLVRAADRALKRKGFHVMLLLRLCPLIPFNGLNYCCGITGVRLEDFAMSLIGILPFQIFTVFVGATAGSLALRDQSQYNPSQEVGFVILIASGCAFGIIALVYIWKLVKKELRKVTIFLCSLGRRAESLSCRDHSLFCKDDSMVVFFSLSLSLSLSLFGCAGWMDWNIDQCC